MAYAQNDQSVKTKTAKRKIKNVVSRIIDQIRVHNKVSKPRFSLSFSPKKNVITPKLPQVWGDDTFTLDASEILYTEEVEETTINSALFSSLRNQTKKLSMSKLDFFSPVKMNVYLNTESDDEMTDYTTHSRGSSACRTSIGSFTKLFTEEPKNGINSTSSLKSCLKGDNSEMDSKTTKFVRFQIQRDNGNYDVVYPKVDLYSPSLESECDSEDDLAYYGI